jgi:hypothetical protein
MLTTTLGWLTAEVGGLALSEGVDVTLCRPGFTWRLF